MWFEIDNSRKNGNQTKLDTKGFVYHILFYSKQQFFICFTLYILIQRWGDFMNKYLL